MNYANSKPVSLIHAVRFWMQSRFSHIKTFLYPYRPRFRDRDFWIIQGLIIFIVVIHDVAESMSLLSELGSLYFLTLSLFFIPLVYASLRFGMVGSIATAIWIMVVTIPDWALWHHSASERASVILSLLMINGLAVFIGRSIDREKTARLDAEETGNALRVSEARLKAYAHSVTRTQEDERQRIAREIHDDSIQSLILLCRRLDSAAASDKPVPPSLSRELAEARETAEKVVGDLRTFITSLRPPALDDLGIVTVTRSLLRKHEEQSGIDIKLKVTGEYKKMPPDIELGLFRIAQETVSNAVRHSRADTINVSLLFTSEEVKLEVLDNGVGFEEPAPASLTAARKLGIIGMHERADLLGGHLNIESSPGKGTKVTAFVRLQSV